jgi:hypothetical protein
LKTVTPATRARRDKARWGVRWLAFPLCGHYLADVSQRTRPKKPANLRSWRVIIMCSRDEYLGSVEAPDRERLRP